MKTEISTHYSDNQESCVSVHLNTDRRYEVTYINHKTGSVVTHYVDTIDKAEDLAENWVLKK